MSSRTELAAALTQLRRTAGLTVRELARRIGAPAGTVGDYLSGRHVPSPAQQPVLTAALRECGVADEAELDQWLDAVRRARTRSVRPAIRPADPYRGLKPFEPEDAALFYGRAAETSAILARIATLAEAPGPSAGLLAVIGPSGSGKSSLLRAGVAAGVRAGQLDTHRDPAATYVRWSVIVTTPSTAADSTLDAGGAAPCVVIIDQFEEMFTSLDAHRRARILQVLTQRRPHVVFILGMRADFYADAAREPALHAALQHGQVLVGPLSREQLLEAILAPAEQAGVTVEDGLADLVLADLAPRDAGSTAHDAGALPLLAHALLATWDRSDGRRMTIDNYRATGGIDAAVQRSAEDLYATLTGAEQDVARRLFLRLVNIDAVAVTRRRVTLEELGRLTADGVDVDRVVDRFVERRLVSANETSVEISHEALLSAWPRLRDWIDADRAGLRLHRQVTDAATSWTEADRDPGLLLRGARLEAAAEWASDDAHRAEMDQLELDFIAAARQVEHTERQRERRRDRRLRRSLVAVAVLAVVAVAFGVYSLAARRDADRERIAAAAARDNALSRQVAIESREIESSDPALAQQLALAAYRIAPTADARSAVIDRSVRPPMTRLVGRQGPTPLTSTSDGHLVAVGDDSDGAVHLYTASGSTPPVRAGVIAGKSDVPELFALAFSPDNHLLATGGAGGVVRLWNVQTPSHARLVATLPTTFTGSIQSIAISPDGATLAAASVGPEPILEWDVSDPTTARPLPSPHGVTPDSTIQSVTFDASGSRLGAGGSNGAIYVWPAASAATTVPRTLTSPTKATVDSVLFDQSGRTLFAGDRAGLILTTKIRAGTLRTVRRVKINTDALINVLALSPDGRELAAGSSDNSVRQWTLSNSRLVEKTGFPGPVTGLRYSPDGRRLLATAADGALREWQASPRAIPVTGSVFNLGFTASGARLEVASNAADGVVKLWRTRDPLSPTSLGPSLRAPLHELAGVGAIRSDGGLVAAADYDGNIGLWDESDPGHPRAYAPFLGSTKLPEQLAFSPDGQLLALASDDHTIRLWDVSNPASPRSLTDAMSGSDVMLNVAFSPDGHLIAGANGDSFVYVWDVRNPAQPKRVAVLKGFAGYAYGVAFSPDGRLLAGASADHTTRLWRTHGVAAPTRFGRPLVGPDNYVWSAAFSPDSKTLAVASQDSTVRVYDVRAPLFTKPAATLRSLDGDAYAVAFSPDGRTVVAGGRPDVVDVWTVEVGSVARSVCASGSDPITRAEWAQYVPGAQYHPPCRDGRPTEG